MTNPRIRRKLAAILSADVVGYSRLMAANEAATVETLKAYRDIIARLVVRRGGRVVNAPGDALLAEFPSAVEAVQAAIEVQKSLEGHNIDLETERRMRFRIGVSRSFLIDCPRTHFSAELFRVHPRKYARTNPRVHPMANPARTWSPMRACREIIGCSRLQPEFQTKPRTAPAASLRL